MTLKILLCDDDSQFATASVAELLKRLSKSCEPGTYSLQPLSNLNQLRKIIKDSAKQWDIIFCDLGWGDLLLEGIQILHDIQMANPDIHTVLYTAQDANDLVDQALEWKLHFVDKVFRVDSAQFYKNIAGVVTELLSDQNAQQVAQQRKKSSELLEVIERFPNLTPHDLIPLSKSAYITFINEKYGGFPQMAIERGLDLNHIYRVNRRFKNSPFVVFKWDTIQEIVGDKDPNERIAKIQTLLCPTHIIRKISP